jgi:hypothetical protein
MSGLDVLGDLKGNTNLIEVGVPIIYVDITPFFRFFSNSVSPKSFRFSLYLK